jgi:hypothetical protein
MCDLLGAKQRWLSKRVPPLEPLRSFAPGPVGNRGHLPRKCFPIGCETTRIATNLNCTDVIRRYD